MRLTYKEVRKFGKTAKLFLVKFPSPNRRYQWFAEKTKSASPEFKEIKNAYWWIQGYISHIADSHL